MKKQFKFAFVFGTFLALVNSSQAADSGSGCGMGSQIFKKNTVISQTLAGATNQLSSQNASITSSTSGCKASGFVKLDRQGIYYAEANYEALSMEMAKGKGESLAGFAQTLGCSDQGVQIFGKMTKTHYQSIFPENSSSPSTLLKSVKEAISHDPFLSKDCNSLRT